MRNGSPPSHRRSHYRRCRLDTPYTESQVTIHADALTLTNQLFDAADNAQLRTELAGLIVDITAHLAEAQGIQAALE